MICLYFIVRRKLSEVLNRGFLIVGVGFVFLFFVIID